VRGVTFQKIVQNGRIQGQAFKLGAHSGWIGQHGVGGFQIAGYSLILAFRQQLLQTYIDAHSAQKVRLIDGAKR